MDSRSASSAMVQTWTGLDLRELVPDEDMAVLVAVGRDYADVEAHGFPAPKFTTQSKLAPSLSGFRLSPE